MAEASLVEDVITTKNTLTVLNQMFIANKISLQPFARIFDSVSALIQVFTHASVKQIETALQTIGSKTDYFDKLRATLNELSDAISTNDTSIINRLNEELDTYVHQLRIDSSSTTNREETADDRFKRQLLHSCKDTEPSSSQVPTPHKNNNLPIRSPARSKETRRREEPPIDDPFAQFRFARRRRSSDSIENDEEIVDSILVPPARLPAPSKPRLMISYNHASKPICVDIYDHLTNDGYDVWVDFKHMHGSTLVAMAKAIEDSDIFVFCVTEPYSKSPNCQKEAEYAFVQQKLMIPILLQSKYKPTGWLGFLLGASFYIDFTKNDFIQNYEKLKSEIETNATRHSSNKGDAVALTPNITAVDREETPRKMDRPLLQSTSPKSVTIENKSRSCVLF